MARPRAESIGKRLRRLREKQGKTMRELSSPGVSYAYISRIEAGARTPSAKALRKLAANLNVSVYYLEYGREQIVYMLTLASLEDPGRVLAALHDKRKAAELETWFREQGHNVYLQEQPVDDAEAIAAVKQEYENPAKT